MKVRSILVGELNTNCYLIASQKDAFIVDPGGDYEKILKLIEGYNLKAIILTHYHPDHTLVLNEIKKATNALVLAHGSEKELLYLLGITPDRYIKDEELLSLDDGELKVVHTPGHSKGSICLIANDFIITGDTLFENGYGRTDLPGGSNDQMKKSLEKLKEIIKPGMKIYPGHGPSFIY
ncbi:MAG: MBL fold metallo-hydrolase [Candidatus Nealsonbacteria bacterium]|nr:MBL fold metallo-hydrolase [Candidatus Nealsonbacteria bacterium]